MNLKEEEEWNQLIQRVKTRLNQNHLMDMARDFYWLSAHRKVTELVRGLEPTTLPVAPRKSEMGKYWTLWLQGFSAAPPIVRICVDVMEEKIGADLKPLDFELAMQHTHLPEPIIDLYLSGELKPQRFSNLIRLDLLNRFGGTWLDSTVLVREAPEHRGLGILYDPKSVMGRTLSIGPNWYLTGTSSHFLIHLFEGLLLVTQATRGRGISRRDMFLLSGVLLHSCEDCSSELTEQPHVSVKPYKSLQMALLKNKNEMIPNAWSGAPFHKLSHKQFAYSREQLESLTRIASKRSSEE